MFRVISNFSGFKKGNVVFNSEVLKWVLKFQTGKQSRRVRHEHESMAFRLSPSGSSIHQRFQDIYFRFKKKGWN